MKKLVFLLVPLLLLAGCAQREPVSGTKYMMNTWVTLTLYDETADEALLEEAFGEVSRMEGIWSRTLSDSEVARLNEAGEAELSSDTGELLARALRLSEETNGAFDPVLGSVTRLWDFAHEDSVPPETSVLEEALAASGRDKLTLSGNTAILSEGAAVDLGGIAKGAAADVLSEFLRDRDQTRAVLNLGGNVYVLGSSAEGTPWKVGIRDPNDESRLFMTVSVSDMAVVTSGIYQRNFTYEGVLYHHILDPETGMPVENDLSSVTVISPCSSEADALATACMVMGEEEGIALIEGIDDTEAVFIRKDGTYAMTSGMGNDIPVAFP